MFGLLFVSTAPAFARDIGEEALMCFNPPIGAAGEVSMIFDVELDDMANVVDATVREGWQPNRDTVLAALRAVQMCAPYRGLEGQSVTASFAAIEPTEIDPFK